MNAERDYLLEGPASRYQQALAAGELQADPAQAEAVACLQQVYEGLQVLQARRPASAWQQLVQRLLPSKRPQPVEGLYLWGGVGRGKTCLMDMFYHALPGDRKQRMHFHRFMGRVHARLNDLRGTGNPLAAIGREFGEQYDVICFDEFFVSDIGDAMLLAGLLEAIFAAGVTLVATSNLPPKRLYENGLQRQQFLPAIRLIETHARVLNLDGGQDYRLRSLEQDACYFTPLGAAASQAMEDCFRRLARTRAGDEQARIEVLGRTLRPRRVADDLIWFDFKELCEGPRSAADYIELAREYHTVLMSDVPQMGSSRDDSARRFIALVDEFYDHGVKLILSAAVPIEQLYHGRELAFAFERTISRLTEMQAHDYLAREHKP